MRMVYNHKMSAALCTRALCILMGLLVPSFVVSGAQSPAEAKPATATVHVPGTLPQAPNASAPAAVPAPAPTPPPPDPLGRSTPYGAVLGFLRAAEAQDYARAAKYLDSRLPEKQSEELALQLKSLLDLGTATELQTETLSRQPEGNLKNELPATREKVGVVTTPAGQLDISLDRVARPNEGSIWLFSHETLDRVPSFYASTQHKDFSRYFPAWTSRVRILSMPLWRWSVIFIAILFDLLIANLFARFVRRILRISLRRHLTPKVDSAIVKLNGPIFGLILALVQRIAADYAITALARHYWILGSILTAVFSTAWMLIRLTDIFISFFTQRLLLQQHIERITFVGLISRLFKILILIGLIIALLTLAGVNVSTLFAGLGIGGIALALAAQKTLADLFGGISIIMRGAVRVNDFCTVAGKTGTVVDIGISSLRIRTLGRSIISIPNSKVAEMELENFSMRDKFWIHQTFTLRFDTPHSTVRKVVNDIAAILTDRPDIEVATPSVRVTRLTPAGTELEVFAYYNKPGADFNSFLEEQGKVILEMMRVVEEAGTSMTTPIGVVRLETEKSQPTHLSDRQ
jgi:MscS family membrane protein